MLRRLTRAFDIPIAPTLRTGFADCLYQHIRYAGEGYKALRPALQEAAPVVDTDISQRLERFS
ncbi:MAG: hypothetical protein J7452_00690 [Thermoflexus sp.]|nr:hypothetical protein [Thermoflexus sp.]